MYLWDPMTVSEESALQAMDVHSENELAAYRALTEKFMNSIRKG